MTQTITPNSQVTMHMIIRVEDGSIAENTRRTARPTRAMIGNGSLSEKFEQALLGLQIGDKKEFHLEAEDAFGLVMPENFLTFPRSQFGEEIDMEEGMIIEFQNMNGQEMLGIVREIREDEVVVDFNHPLAGHALDFEIEVMEIN
ncbi:MAG: peptidyl-prolyl cis-trans isomerase [Gammaproteobacteria bacterium]|jgi:FKBP-type peptidyl-prolyl cis-trans isomerase SlpA|nr:peptidyl-prolyl cis-trans isomerase [Gammaproteobacteria bacterium]